jgi:D-xylose transport system substrate-binding protein
MRSNRALILVSAGIAATALTLTACSSSGNGGGGNTAGSTGGNPGGSTAASAPSGGGSPQVGVILPDTTTSNRYTLYDAPLLSKAFKDAGISAVIQNAHGSSSTFVSDAQTMITQGVKVLLIDPADPQTGISVEKAAQSAGVQVIDYDRVNLGGSAAYYVSFDNEKVGELQGQGLLKCLSNAGVKSNPNIIELNGGTDIDNNAVLFKAGAHKVFQAAGVKPKVETDVKGWDNTVAATDFQQAYTQDPSVQGVLAANDGIAAAAISTLKQHHQQIPVTGQDATVQGIQYILTGDQCLTIFKDVRKEAQAASALAIALINGDTAKANSLATGSLKDPVNGRTIPSVLLTPAVITKSNVNVVIDAGALTKEQICKGIQSACTKAGL